MDFKGEYRKLFARVVAGVDDQGNDDTAAALGRQLAESEVDPDDVARVHAAAVEQCIAAQAADQWALSLLRASRLLAEVMLWRGVAGTLARHKQWAESGLRDLGRVAETPSLRTEPEEPQPPFRQPLDQARAFLERVAVTDPLTGIYNARHFNVALEAQVKAARESATLLSLLLMDVDGLSRYNEVHGRRQGDEALAMVARLLMGNTRRSDFVARCGGDEFAIILPNCTARQALALAERIRCAVDEQGLPDGLTASLGIATFPTDAASDRELVNVTQQACYLAQRLGGNTVCTALVAEVEGARSPGEP